MRLSRWGGRCVSLGICLCVACHRISLYAWSRCGTRWLYLRALLGRWLRVGDFRGNPDWLSANPEARCYSPRARVNGEVSWFGSMWCRRVHWLRLSSVVWLAWLVVSCGVLLGSWGRFLVVTARLGCNAGGLFASRG